MTPTRTELPAIDLETEIIPGQSLKDAREFLDLYMSRLPNEKTKFANAYDAQDWPNLGKEAHRLLGASCYVGVPAIRQALQNLELSVKKMDIDAIEKSYQDWLAEYERLIKACNESD